MGQTDMNTTNAASLRGKLSTLEENISQITDDMSTHKKEVNSLATEKNTLQDILKLRVHEVRLSLMTELNKLDTEVSRHVAHQKAENSKLLQLLSQLKQEKSLLNNTINSKYK